MASKKSGTKKQGTGKGVAGSKRLPPPKIRVPMPKVKPPKNPNKPAK